MARVSGLMVEPFGERVAAESIDALLTTSVLQSRTQSSDSTSSATVEYPPRAVPHQKFESTRPQYQRQW